MWDEERVQELIQFQQKHGHCEVPHDDEEHENLSAWIRQVRSSYASWMNGDDDGEEHKQTTNMDLTEGRFVDLQNLGLDLYLLRPVQSGKRRLKQLLAYKRLHGHHYRVGASDSVDFPKLTKWLKNLRAAHDIREEEEEEEEEIPILVDVQLSQLEKIGYDFNYSPQSDDVEPIAIGRRLDENAWKCRVEELKEFKRIHGHFRVPSANEKYASLYNWTRDCRYHLKKFLKGEKVGLITDDRLLQLKAIGFDVMASCDNDRSNLQMITNGFVWTKSQQQKTWDEWVEELKKFKDTYGHFQVGKKGEHKSLGAWLQNCRCDFNRISHGEKTQRGLTEERIQSLRTIGFEFTDSSSKNWEQRVDTREYCSWDQRVEELKKFKDTYGHFRVGTNGEHKSLGTWLHNCRGDFNRISRGKKPQSRLTEERIQSLRAIGFEFTISAPRKNWDQRVEKFKKFEVLNWEQRVEELKKFKDTYGHFQVGSTGEHKSLGKWLHNCQSDFNRISRGEKAKKLTEERIQSLRAIGFEFTMSAPQKNWDQRVEELKKFKDTYGHFRVGTNGEHKSLGKWLHNCQSDFKRISRGEKAKRGLTEERIQSLRGIGFEFTISAPRKNWDQRVEELKKFKDTYGHFRVGSNGEHKSFYMWLQDCRSDFNRTGRGEKAKKLTEERIQSLRAIGFEFTHSANQGSKSIIETNETMEWTNSDGIPSEPSSRIDRCEDGVQQLKNIKHAHRHIAASYSGTECKSTTKSARVPKEARLNTPRQNVGTPKVSHMHIHSGESLAAIVVTPEHHADTSMHQGSEEEEGMDDEVEVAVEVRRSPKESRIESSSNNQHHHASRIHHPQWQQQQASWTPIDSDGRDYANDNGVNYRQNVARSPCNYINNNARGHQSVQAPSYYRRSHSTDATGSEGEEIPLFIDGLEDAVNVMMKELNRREQNQDQVVAASGRPNQFWLEIGNKDGIDFFPSSSRPTKRPSPAYCSRSSCNP